MSKSGFTYKSIDRVILLLICLHIAISLFLANSLNIWADELSTLNTTGRGIHYALTQSIGYELQPPLYFAMLAVWRVVNNSIFYARMFSVLCTSLTLYIIAELSKRFVPHINPAFVVACVSFNPFLIWAAVELKSPAFVMLISSLLFLVFHDAFLIQEPKKLRKWLYVIVAVSGLYTKYFLGFILVANAVALLILKRWKSLQNYFICMIATGAFFLPVLLLIFPAKLSALSAFQSEGVLKQKSFGQALRDVYGSVLRFVLPASGPTVGIFETWRRLRYTTVLFLGFILIRYRRYIDDRNLAIWLIVLTLSCVFLVLGLKTGLLFEHYLSLLFPVATLAVFSIFSLIPGGLGKNVVITWTVVTLVASGISLMHVYTPLAKQGDWHRVSAYIKANEQPGQPIVVYTPEVADIMKYYYNGRNLFIPLPQKEDFKVYDLQKLVLNDEQEIAEKIEINSNSKVQEIWLVVDRVLCTVPTFQKSCQLLDDYATKHYNLVKERTFSGSTAQLLRRKN